MTEQRKYVGARYVPLFMGEWDNTKTYEPLSIVYDNGFSYTSRTYVPAGIDIDNEVYWALTGEYASQILELQGDVSTLEDIIPVSAFSSANTVKDAIDDVAGVIPASAYNSSNTVKSAIDKKLVAPTAEGTQGQILTLGTGGATSWSDVGTPTDAQVESAVSDWLDDHPSATTTVTDGSVTNAKLAQSGGVIDEIQYINDRFIDSNVYKNLFNYKTRDRADGIYCNYSDGKIKTNASYSTLQFPVKPGSVLSFSTNTGTQGGAHIVFSSVHVDLASVSTNVVIDGFISGNLMGYQTPAHLNNISVPATARYMLVSIDTAKLENVQFEIGTSYSNFSKYGTDPFAHGNMLTVGTGMRYSTIAAAISAANDYDTIYIMPGTYTETINAYTKTLKFVGFCRDRVIWKATGDNYQYPPLHIASGVVENITFEVTATEVASGAVAAAYCVHIDNDAEIDKSLQFINCRFTSNIQYAIGIGLRRNFRLSFVGCDFYTRSYKTWYCHEAQSDDNTAEYVELINCSLRSDGDYPAIVLQETPAYDGNVAVIRFQRCIAKSRASQIIQMVQYGTQPGLDGDGYLGSKVWLLDNMSDLNNASILNA